MRRQRCLETWSCSYKKPIHGLDLKEFGSIIKDMDFDKDFFCDDGGLLHGKVDEEVLDSVKEFLCDDTQNDNDDTKNDVFSSKQQQYTVMDEERIRQLQDNVISEVCRDASLSRAAACTLLIRNNWDRSLIFEWALETTDYDDDDDDDDDDDNDGLLEVYQRFERLITPKPDINNINNQSSSYCKICLEENKENMLPAPYCGHPFCTDCWKSYIAASINEDGPACLQLCCPEHGCKDTVGLDMIESLSSEQDKQKYYRYLVRSYVESDDHLKCCPGPGCNRVIWIKKFFKSYDVVCDCSYGFCWNCLEERHHPVDCMDMEKWIKCNSSSEAEKNNQKWIRAFTKPCPMCRRKIEKVDEGCIHMTCPIPCGHHFCWLCLKPWNNNNNNNHGTDICIEEYKYYEEEYYDDRRFDLEDTRRKLIAYRIFHNGWLRQDKLMENAMQNISRAKNGLIRKLAGVQKLGDESKLQFVIEALEQIVESRQLLKWSCVYGMYECLSIRNYNGLRIRYFGHLEGQAEAAVMILQRCAYEDLKKCMMNDSDSDFMDFRAKLVNLTNVNKNYFDKFAIAMERKLRDATRHIFAGQPPQPLYFGDSMITR